MKLKSYQQFLNEAKETTDLNKIYLVYNPDLGHRFWTYKDFAADKYFIRLTPDNYEKIDIDKSMPLLTYHSDTVQMLIDKGLIDEKNVYNHPKFIKNSGSKSNFHKLVDGDENIPKTCHSTEKAIEEIGFPMIAKPAEGHSGIGISVIKNQKQFDSADHDKLDVYSEFVDKKSEHRFFTFKGKPIFWQERMPTNDKAKTGDGDGDEKMMFNYHKKKLENTPEKFKTLITKFGKIFSDLPFICFDIMEDQKGKLYIIESNAMPGVPFDTTVDMYKCIFNDFYGRSVNKDTEIKLQEFADFMLEKSKNMDGGKRFTFEK
jgi:hypothetical protein